MQFSSSKNKRKAVTPIISEVAVLAAIVVAIFIFTIVMITSTILVVVAMIRIEEQWVLYSYW